MTENSQGDGEVAMNLRNFIEQTSQRSSNHSQLNDTFNNNQKSAPAANSKQQERQKNKGNSGQASAAQRPPQHSSALQASKSRKSNSAVRSSIAQMIKDSNFDVEQVSNRSVKSPKNAENRAPRIQANSNQSDHEIEEDHNLVNTQKQAHKKMAKKSQMKLAQQYKMEAERHRQKKQVQQQMEVQQQHCQQFVSHQQYTDEDYDQTNEEEYQSNHIDDQTPQKYPVQQLPSPQEPTNMAQEIAQKMQILQGVKERDARNQGNHQMHSQPTSRIVPGTIQRREQLINSSCQQQQVQRSTRMRSASPLQVLDQADQVKPLAGCIMRVNSSHRSNRSFTRRSDSQTSQNMAQANHINQTQQASEIIKHIRVIDHEIAQQSPQFEQQEQYHEPQQVIKPFNAGHIQSNSAKPPLRVQDNQIQLQNQRPVTSQEEPSSVMSSMLQVPPTEHINSLDDFYQNTIWYMINNKNVKQITQQILDTLDQFDEVRGKLQELIQPEGIRQQAPRMMYTKNQNRLQLMRQALRVLYKEQALDKVREILTLKERYDYRRETLKQATKERIKSNNQQTAIIKQGIINDICLRLKQKMVLQVLRVNNQLKFDLYTQFEAYHDLLIDQPLKKSAFATLVKYRKYKHDQRQYLAYSQIQLQQIKKQQIWDAWKNCRAMLKIRQERLDNAKALLNARIQMKIVNKWRTIIVYNKLRKVSNMIANRFYIMKKRHQLFAKWVYKQNQTNKIKKKALKLVNRKFDQSGLVDFEVNEQWLNQANEKSQELFYAQIKELLLEKDHLSTILDRLNHKLTPEQLDKAIPLQLEDPNEQFFENPQFLTHAYLSNQEKIYCNYPDMDPRQRLLKQTKKQSAISEFGSPRFNGIHKSAMTQALGGGGVSSPRVISNTADQQQQLEAKYQIHNAYVMQQNLFANKAKQSEQKPMQASQSFSMMGRSFNTARENQQQNPLAKHKKQYQSSFIMPLTRNASQESFNNKSSAPNELFKKLEKMQVAAQQKTFGYTPQQEQSFQQVPYQIQVQDHAKQLIKSIRKLKTIQKKHHLSVSMIAQSDQNDLQFDPKATYTIQDYIQFGMQSDNPTRTFSQLSAVRMKSQFLHQWKIRLQERLLSKDLHQMHTCKMSKQLLQEWGTLVKRNQLKSVNYYKTKHLQNFYNLFTNWAKRNQQIIAERNRKVYEFRLQTIMKSWLIYIKKNGELQRKMQYCKAYYDQSLKSKALVAIYQYYLKMLRIKKFQKRLAYINYFKNRWMPKAKKSRSLRKVLTRVVEISSDSERSELIRRRSELKSVFDIWTRKTKERTELVKQYMALSHYKNHLISQAFYAIKTRTRVRLGAQILSGLVRESRLVPTMSTIQRHSQIFLDETANWYKVRERFLKHRVITNMRQIVIKKKLARMFFMKKYINKIQDYIYRKNIELPMEFREHRMKLAVFLQLKNQKDLNWQKKKKQIIGRALDDKRNDKLLKLCFLKLLENILIQKKKRIIKHTVTDFRKHGLTERTFKVLKINMMRKRKDRLMNQVAQEFREERLRYKIISDQKQGFINQDNGQFLGLDDLLKQKVFCTWKKIAYENTQLASNVRRHIAYKEQILLVRCFLSWRSVVRYDQTSASVSKSHQSNSISNSLTNMKPVRNSTTSNYLQTSEKYQQSTSSRLKNNSSVQIAVREEVEPDKLSDSLINTEIDVSGIDQNSQSYQQFMLNQQSKDLMYSHSGIMINNKPSVDINKNSLMTASNRQILAELSETEEQQTELDQNTNYDKYNILRESSSIQDYNGIDASRSYTNEELIYLRELREKHQTLPCKDDNPVKQANAFNTVTTTNTGALFDELETIYAKNQKWIDEQKNREDMLNDMANQYNVRLSQDLLKSSLNN